MFPLTNWMLFLKLQTDDEKLAKSAEVYHYMHAKKQLAAMERWLFKYCYSIQFFLFLLWQFPAPFRGFLRTELAPHYSMVAYFQLRCRSIIYIIAASNSIRVETSASTGVVLDIPGAKACARTEVEPICPMLAYYYISSKFAIYVITTPNRIGVWSGVRRDVAPNYPIVAYF